MEDGNDKHLEPWSTLCASASPAITHTPLMPFLYTDLLSNHGLSVDGSKIKEYGFVYSEPMVTKALVREQIDAWIKVGAFPDNIIAPP